MRVTPWRPFRDLDDVFGRYSRLLGNGLPNLPDDSGDGTRSWAPSADISETKREYVIKADLPDVEKDDISVSVRDRTLIIQGERKHRTEEEDETYHRVESFHGAFSRSFVLPDNADESKIKADCKKGVLRVRIPKTKVSEAATETEIKVD